MTKLEATQAFNYADELWSAKLKKLGKKVANVRYLPAGRGEPGTELRRLYEAREAARQEFEKAWAHN